MEEKSIMTKSGRSTDRKRNSNTTKSMFVNVEQAFPSEKVFDAIPIAILSVDWSGRLQYMNRAAKSMLGEPNQQLQLDEWPAAFGFYLDDGMLPYPSERLPLARALRGEIAEDAEEMILRRPGSEKEIWIAFSAEILRDENGNVDGAIAMIRDISYREQVELSREKHVRHTEALYRFSHAIAEAGNDLTAITNLVTRFTAEVML